MVDSYSTQAMKRCDLMCRINVYTRLFPAKLTLIEHKRQTMSFIRHIRVSPILLAASEHENKNSPNLIYFWIKEFQKEKCPGYRLLNYVLLR